MKNSGKMKIIAVTLSLIIVFSFMALSSIVNAPVSGSYASYCKQPTTYTWFSRISTTDVANGDNVGVWYTLPWSFPYFGASKSRVYICSNGFLIFDPTQATTDSSNSLGELKSRWMIAPFWDNLRTDVSGGIVSTPGVYVDNMQQYGCVVITWEATRYGSSSDSIKFQVVLASDGTIRISINSATNFANFSPTLGISKGTTIDFIDITGEKGTGKTWNFLYDINDLFYYDRAGVPIIHEPTYLCLTSNGYVNYGQCHCGPPVSRDYVPDYFQWYCVDDNWFGTDLAWTENLYSSAQSWSGKDFCFTLEYNIPRVSGTVTYWYSNIPNSAWTAVSQENWGGVNTWELDVHTFSPESIQVNTVYWADIAMSMETGYSIDDVVGQESELYEDGFPWILYPPCGVQLDWFKQYLGSYWINAGVVRFGCGPPKELMNQMAFPGGVFSAVKTVNSTLTQIWTMPEKYGDLTDYISSRIDATKQLIASTKQSQNILATVTFTTPISPDEYAKLVKKFGIEVNSYSIVGTEGYGGAMAPSKQLPYDETIEITLKKRGVEVVGVTGFTGSICANEIISLQNDVRILLVDPWEDLTVQQLKQQYLEVGYSVDVRPTFDLWPYWSATEAS